MKTIQTMTRGEWVIAGCAIIVLIFIALALWPKSTPYCDCPPEPPITETHAPKIVYTRQPYNATPIPGNVADSELSNFQNASDVSRINGGLDEADVVIDALDGSPAKVIWDCTNNYSLNCVAHDPKVSPDAKKIAFSVGYSLPGPNGLQVQFSGAKEGLQAIVCSQIHIYDIATGIVTPIPQHPGGNCSLNDGQWRAVDREPSWLTNDRIVFTSARANKWTNRDQHPQGLLHCFNYPACVSQSYPYGDDGKAMQLWAMNIDGTNAVNLGPHDLNARSPQVMTNGDIYYTTFVAHGDKGFAPGRNVQVAAPNLMWLNRVDSNGADMTTKLHGHKQNRIKAAAWLPTEPTIGGMSMQKGGVLYNEELRGMRSPAEIFPKKLAVSSYYRNNHNGSMGAIYGFKFGHAHVEGCAAEDCEQYPMQVPPLTYKGSGLFMPPSLVSLTPWGQSGDDDPGFEYLGPNTPPRSFGKAGYPAPWDKDHYIITHRLGQCYAAATGQEVTRSWLGEDWVCRGRIMLVNAPGGELLPTMNPFDPKYMTPLVDDPRYQIWDAHPIKTYMELYGQAAPTLKAPLTPGKCYIQVVNAKASELYPHIGGHPQWESTKRCGWQGCAVKPDAPLEMKYLTISLPELFDFGYTGNNDKFKMTMNNRGEMAVKSWGDFPLEADGSIKLEMPCDTPFMISGSDAEHNITVHDDLYQSLRPGETRTCHGCHDAHSTERFKELGQIAATTRFLITDAAQKPAQTGVKTNLPKWADVQPMITGSCGSCHTGFENDQYMYSRVVWDVYQMDMNDWLPIVPPVPGSYVTELWRPLTSRFVSKFAVESPLYWYANNKRMDGHLNDERTWDIDYKVGHPMVELSADQVRIMGDWLDNGAPF